MGFAVFLILFAVGSLALLLLLFDFERRWVRPSTNRFALLGLAFLIGNFLLLGGALAIVVFYLITSRLILQPVRVLKNTAEKVAMGDLNIRLAISTGDELPIQRAHHHSILRNFDSRLQLNF